MNPLSWIIFTLNPCIENENYGPSSTLTEMLFHGYNAINFTLYALKPDDTQYAVCTTLQYFGSKPAANTTMLTVEPQTTHETAPTKTPEQMQQEAEQNGWLKPPRAWFSWWYPWFRLYYTLVYNGIDVLDVGLSPLGGDEIITYSHFDSWLADAINEIIISPIAQALFIGWIGTEAIAYVGMYLGPAGFLGGLSISLGIKELLFQTTSDSGLKGAFVGACFSYAYGFITTLKKVVDLAIEGVSQLLNLLEADVLNFWKLIFKFIHIPINMIYLIRIIFRLVAAGLW
jgi:hypothetical protein